MMASAMATVGTWVGFVQPGSLSLVHSELARATRTRVALSKSFKDWLGLLGVPTWSSFRTWWRMWWCMWCECGMAARRLS